MLDQQPHEPTRRVPVDGPIGWAADTDRRLSLGFRAANPGSVGFTEQVNGRELELRQSRVRHGRMRSAVRSVSSFLRILELI